MSVGLSAGGAQDERFRGKLSPIFSPIAGAPTTLANTMPSTRKQVKCLLGEQFLILATTRPFPEAWPFFPGSKRCFFPDARDQRHAARHRPDLVRWPRPEDVPGAKSRGAFRQRSEGFAVPRRQKVSIRAQTARISTREPVHLHHELRQPRRAPR